MADDKEETPESPDIHFEPLVNINNLPLVDAQTLDQDEEELIKLRARLYRYDKTADPAEWKERGTGDVKLLKHKERGTCRILMRREKTLKTCANHYVLPVMELKPNCGSDKVWVYSTPADYSDEESRSELLAIRFGNAENAQKFFDKFEDAKKMMEDHLKEKEANSNSKKEAGGDSCADDMAEKLGLLSVKEDKNEPSQPSTSPSDNSEKEVER